MDVKELKIGQVVLFKFSPTSKSNYVGKIVKIVEKKDKLHPERLPRIYLLAPKIEKIKYHASKLWTGYDGQSLSEYDIKAIPGYPELVSKTELLQHFIFTLWPSQIKSVVNGSDIYV